MGSTAQAIVCSVLLCVINNKRHQNQRERLIAGSETLIQQIDVNWPARGLNWREATAPAFESVVHEPGGKSRVSGGLATVLHHGQRFDFPLNLLRRHR